MGEVFQAAFLVSIEAALAAALAWVAVAARSRGRAAPIAASAFVGLAIGVAVALSAGARGVAFRDFTLSLVRFRALQVLALLAGAYLLRRSSAAADPSSPRWRAAAGELAALALGLSWSFADGFGLGGLLSEAAVLAGGAGTVALTAAAAALAAAVCGLAVAWVVHRLGLGRALPPAAFLALLFALKLAGVGALGAQLSPVAMALTNSVGRIIHDAVHVGFVLAQIPDHPYLRDEVYQLILVILEPLPHAIAAIAVFGAPLALAWRRFGARPPPALDPASRPPVRRLARAAFRRASLLGGAAFALALALSSAAILSAHAKGEELYEPLPEPVVDDGAGTVLVPLGGPLAGADTRMRKFAWSHAGRTITFFTVRRADGTLAAALDACEICQPRGYAQMGSGYVFCKYCKTPIPVATVGQPGGCNPVPLPSAQVEAGVLRIAAAELRALHEKWGNERR